MIVWTKFLARTQKYLYISCMTPIVKVIAILNQISEGHLVTLRLSSIEPSPYLDGWPFEKLSKYFYFFMISWLIRRFHSIFKDISSLECKNFAKKWTKKGILSNWSSLFDRGSKRSPIQVRLGSMLLNFGATKWPPKIELKMAIFLLRKIIQ